MSSIDSISGILIDLDVDESKSLYILLDEHGSINRIGTGSLNNTENDLWIGMLEDNTIFKTLRAAVPSDWLDLHGRYEFPDRKGAECKLTIMLHMTDDKDIALEILHGSESDHPPADVTEFVRKAVELTAEWMRSRKDLVEIEPEKKPWWKLW